MLHTTMLPYKLLSLLAFGICDSIGHIFLTNCENSKMATATSNNTLTETEIYKLYMTSTPLRPAVHRTGFKTSLSLKICLTLILAI